jgi:hypothetical protein
MKRGKTPLASAMPATGERPVHNSPFLSFIDRSTGITPFGILGNVPDPFFLLSNTDRAGFPSGTFVQIADRAKRITFIVNNGGKICFKIPVIFVRVSRGCCRSAAPDTNRVSYNECNPGFLILRKSPPHTHYFVMDSDTEVQIGSHDTPMINKDVILTKKGTEMRMPMATARSRGVMPPPHRPDTMP